MAVGVALFLVVGAVWFLTADARHWSDRPFDSCSVRDGNLILKYGYGSGEDVRFTVDQTESGYRVRLEAHVDDGPHLLVLLHGELRLDRFNTGDVVMQHDGSRLTCAQAVERPVS